MKKRIWNVVKICVDSIATGAAMDMQISRQLLAWFMGIAVSFASGPAQAATGYVAQNGQTPSSPFTTWDTAASNIQDAVAVAANTLVLVSNGTYSITNEIPITNALVLRSMNGAANTIVRRASGSTRIFNMSANAVIDGFTIREGALAAKGGGVLMTLGTVQNCMLVTNKSTGGDGGGAVYMSGGTLSNCVITGNSSSYDGGGVYLMGSGVVRDCVITNNTATAGNGNGGGVHAYNCSGTLRNCLIAGNNSRSGGGFAVEGTTSLKVESCTIVSNSATGYGGGFYNFSGAPCMTNTIVYFNKASTSGNNLIGAITAGYSCCPDLTAGVNGNITLDPEFVDYQNSDFRIRPGSPCMDAGTNQNWMTNSMDIAANPRIQNGRTDMGAYEVTSSNLPYLCNFRTAVATNNMLEVVFAPYVSGPDTNITWCGWDFTNDGSYDQTFANLAMATNVYADVGIYSIKLAVSNATGNATSAVKTLRINSTNGVAYVSTNGLSQWPYHTWARAATNIQDAINVGASLLVLVSNGTYAVASTVLLDNNTVLRSVNGATNTIIRRSSGSIGVLSISTSSGGIVVTNATIDGFTIRDGSAPGDGGGGVYCRNGTVKNCIVIGNSASPYDGGGVYCRNGTVLNCIVTNNSAARYGGGVAFYNNGGVKNVIRNCLVARNKCSVIGGGVSLEAGDLSIESCTIASNSANTGGGIYLIGATKTMTNSIVYFNKATTGTNISGTVTAGYSCSPDLTAGANGNITNDPVFINYANGDCHLLAGSPCINTGTNQNWMFTAIDLDGNKRVFRATVDMGAYETVFHGTIFTVR